MAEEIVDKIANKILTQVKYGKAYFTKMEFNYTYKMFIDFVEDRQWGPITQENVNLPRPVFNIVHFAVVQQTADITSENLRLVYSPMEVPGDAIDPSTVGQNPDGTINMDNVQLDFQAQAAKDFTHFAEYEWEALRQDYLCALVVRDSAIYGSGLLHYYWDSTKSGGYSEGSSYIGDMMVEQIKPSYIYYGNPQDTRLQEQPWIILAYRDLVSKVRSEARRNKISESQIKLISGETTIQDDVFEAARYEMIDTDKTDVYLTYWRDDDGIVNHAKIANGIVISEPAKLSKHRLYPVANFIWEERAMCIYGRGECEGIIANQKLLNWTVASSAMNVNLTGNPKIIVKNDALKQPITNKSGEIIYDKGLPNVENIKYMQPPQMTSAADNIREAIVSLTRQFRGINEVSTGEPFSKELNASAIIALQQQAKIPRDATRRRYYQFREDGGRIMEEFFKYEFSMTRRFKTRNPVDGTEVSTEFNGSQYADVPLITKIDIGVASNFSDVLMTAQVEKWLQMGAIPFELALDAYPESTVQFKDEFKKKYQEWQMQQQQQQMQMQQQQETQIQQQQAQEQQSKQQDTEKEMAMKSMEFAMKQEEAKNKQTQSKKKGK